MWLYKPPQNRLPKHTRQVEGEFDMEIVSLIVQQHHADVTSFLALVPILLILLNLVTYVGDSQQDLHYVWAWILSGSV